MNIHESVNPQVVQFISAVINTCLYKDVIIFKDTPQQLRVFTFKNRYY